MAAPEAARLKGEIAELREALAMERDRSRELLSAIERLVDLIETTAEALTER